MLRCGPFVDSRKGQAHVPAVLVVPAMLVMRSKSMPAINFMEQAQALRERVVAWRRDFHQHPELAFEEVRTANIVQAELTALGLEVQGGVGRTGVVAILEGAHDGPTILVRADMDALPIREENDSPYTSQTQGKMHACGHDGHTAIALGVATLLAQHRDQLAGRIKFVFQPAEEIAAGAKAMVADGVLSDPRPSASLGLHLWNTLPVGHISLVDGPQMASASNFRIALTGRGGHGATPMLTADPVVCGAQIITALQTIVSRNVDPLDTAVVSVTQMHTGDADNVIPQYAELRGTFRAYNTPTRDLMATRITAIAQQIALAMDCTAEVEIAHKTKPVSNDSNVVQQITPVMQAAVNGLTFVQTRTMGAEDMGEFMSDIPGAYFFVGAHVAGRDLNHGHHHPLFEIDEDALPLGVALLSAAAASYLLKEG
jgi:amidohydrolase